MVTPNTAVLRPHTPHSQVVAYFYQGGKITAGSKGSQMD